MKKLKENTKILTITITTILLLLILSPTINKVNISTQNISNSTKEKVQKTLEDKWKKMVEDTKILETNSPIKTEIEWKGKDNPLKFQEIQEIQEEVKIDEVVIPVISLYSINPENKRRTGLPYARCALLLPKNIKEFCNMTNKILLYPNELQTKIEFNIPLQKKEQIGAMSEKIQDLPKKLDN